MNLEKDYLRALENNYNIEQFQIKVAKQRFERSAVRIQRMFRSFKRRKIMNATLRIQRWSKNLLRELRYKQQRLAYFKEIYFVQKIRAVLVRKIRWRKSLKRFKPRNIKVQPILQSFIQRLKILLILLRRRLRKDLMFKLRFCIMKSIGLKELKQTKLKHYKQLLDFTFKKDAIEKEIEFIQNVKQTNLECFDMHWATYQQKLVKFLNGRQRADDWVPQQDEFGDRNWVNLKTLQTVTENPVQIEIQENVKRLKASALKQLNQQTQYLTDNINELQLTSEALRPQLNVNLSLIYKTFLSDRDFTIKFRKYLSQK